MDPSEALKARIHQKIARIDERYPGVVRCDVVVEAAHHHQKKGRLYSVRIDVSMPKGELVVSHHPGKDPKKHEKVYASMNDAFQAIEKQLEKFLDLMRADIKSHDPHTRSGVVSNLFVKEGYGFLSTNDGREIYFHRNAVQNDRFSEMEIGSRARFVLAKGEGRNGPQASVVRLG